MEIGSMATGRDLERCLVVSPSAYNITIVGGNVSFFEALDIFEDCIIV